MVDGLYELALTVASSSDRQNRDTATDTFRFVDLDAPEVNSEELQDSSVAAAESQRQTASVTTDVDRATFDMSDGGSDLDLHLYDQDGNHVGRNYDTGEFEEEIPGAVPSGPDGLGESAEAVRVADPADSYDVEVVGLETDEGGTDFTTNGREVPDLEPVMNVTPRRVSAVSRGGVIQRQITVQEVADADSLSEVSLEAQDLTGQNTGDVLPADSISFDRSDFGVDSGDNETVTMSIEVPDGVSPDNYAGQVETNSAEDSVSISVSVSHAVVVDEPPRDLDSDQLFEDIDGSGSLDIFDVRALFNNLDNPAVQGNPQYFDFDEDGSEEVDIFDVRGLFNIFAAQASSNTDVEDASELSDDEFTSLISE